MSEPPIPSPRTQKKTGLLLCPFCEHEFPLSWRLYWTQGLTSRVKCPQCGEKSHLQWTSAYSGFLLILTVATASITALTFGAQLLFAPLTDSKGPTIEEILSLIGVLFCVAFPLDKYADAHFRPLVKHKRKRKKPRSN